MVIEKNKTNIFSGLIAALLVQESPISLIGHKVVATKITAPNKAISQYVSKENFPNLSLGKNNVDRVIPKNVITEMTIVAIIQTTIIGLYIDKAIQNIKK